MPNDYQTHIYRNDVNDSIGAYIYFCMSEQEKNEELKSIYFETYDLCVYFDLPTTRKLGEPTYSSLHYDIFEIGFISVSLDDAYEKIKSIQEKIIKKGGKIINGDKEIKIIYNKYYEDEDEFYNE